MFDDDNDNYDSDVALKGDVTLYRTSTPLVDVICDKESKEACKNRLREYFIEAYNETFVNVYLTGKAAVRNSLSSLVLRKHLLLFVLTHMTPSKKIVKP